MWPVVYSQVRNSCPSSIFRYQPSRFPSETSFSSIVRQPRSIHPILRSNFVDMPRALSPNKSRSVKTMLALSMDVDVIASKAKCSTRSVRRIRNNLASFGTVQHQTVVKRGRPFTLTPEMQQVSLYVGFCRCSNCKVSLNSLNIDVLDMLTRWRISFGTNMA